MSREEWQTANASYLAHELERLRLVLRRHILWLRHNWRRQASQDYSGWAITDQEADLLLLETDSAGQQAFFQSDPESAGIADALAEITGQIAGEREEMRNAGNPPPVDVLATRFDLTAFERETMLLCLAPEIDPSFERLYGYVQDDATRRFATPHLALSLFAGSQFQSSERASFLAEAPLRRWRLVSLIPANSAGSGIASPMRLDDRVVDYLSGINHLEDKCRRLVRQGKAAPAAVCHLETAGRLARWMNTGAQWSKLVNLVGRPDSGRLTIAQQVCDQAGLNLLVLDDQALLAAGSERGELLTLLDREAILLTAAFYFDPDSLKADEAQLLLKELDRFAAPLMIASRERLSSEREMLAVAVERPDARSQSELWRRSLGPAGHALNGVIDSIVEQFDFGSGGIARAAALALNQAASRDQGADGPALEDIWLACRQQTSPQLEQLARKVESCYDWDDIVVPADVLRQLREITSQVAHRYKVYQAWGFGKKLKRGRGISALFSGPSGVGKTMAAEVIAHDLGLDLYRIDLAGVVSKYIGETEKNLRGIFDAAERSGAILFFDEADALFGKRSEIKDSHDRYANIEVNYLLQRMEDYRGLAILATNMKSALDSAFMRRLRFIVEFPFPDASQRKEIWQKVFPVEAAVEGLEYGVLARLEIPGGHIRNIAVNSAFLAAGEGQLIGMDQVMRAARREYTKIDRLIMDSEFGRFAREGVRV